MGSENSNNCTTSLARALHFTPHYITPLEFLAIFFFPAVLANLTLRTLRLTFFLFIAEVLYDAIVKFRGCLPNKLPKK